MIVLDCDTGRDDALTILYAVLSGLGLKGIFTSYGNTPLENVTKNTLGVLSLLNEKANSIEVIEGSSLPIRSHVYIDKIVKPRMKISGNGLCDIELPINTQHLRRNDNWLIAAESFFKQLNDQVDYIITGPCSNFSLMLDVFPDLLKSKIKHLTIMGGKLGKLWQEQLVPDFNFAADPFAVDDVLSCDIPIRIVTIDISNQIFINLEEIRKFSPKTEIGNFCVELMEKHLVNFVKEDLFKFHDPLTALSLNGWGDFRKAKVRINIDEKTPDFGRLIEVGDGKDVELFSIDPQETSVIHHFLEVLTVI